MLLEFLNQNSGAFSVIFSCIVTMATVVYAILTWRLVTETKQMREAQTEPIISIILKPKDEWKNFIDLIIKNIGPGSAHKINFQVDPDFEYEKGKYLSEINVIKNGLNYLAPGQEINFFLTSLVENYNDKIKTAINIKVKYQNMLGNIYEKTFLIDFSEFAGLTWLGTPPLHEIAENIKKIGKNIDHLCSGFSKLNVISHSKSDVEADYAERRALVRELSEQQSKKD